MKEVSALIQSLTSAEKQHFKKRHTSNADFILLFDCINKKKNTTTKEAINYLTKKGKKTYTSSYLSVVKSYLKTKILESLRIQYIHKKKSYELLSKSMNVDILLEKGLYDMAKSEIDTSIESNFESSFPIEKMLLLRRKSLLTYYENYDNSNLQQIEDMFAERINVAEQVLLEIKIAKIVSILSFQYFKGEKDIKLLESFMKEDYMQDESLLTDFSTKYLFHWVHSQFEEFNDNAEGSHIHFNKSIQLWLDNPNYIDAHPRMYLSACFTFFKYMLQQNDPFSSILERMNFTALLSTIKSENLSDEEQDKYLGLFRIFEIISHRHKGQFKDILKIISPLLNDRKHISSQPHFDKIIFYYYSALTYYELNDLKNARSILEEYVFPLDHRLIQNPAYTTVFIMLYLIILYELKNLKQLRYQLSKCKKYLQEESKLTILEHHFFNMLSQLISERHALTHDEVYERFHKRLIKAVSEDQRGIKIEYNYIVAWVEQRLDQ